MTPLLAATSISVTLNQIPVLTDVSLALSPGEMLALVGPNGSGKTTLLRALLGHVRASGTIEWSGRPLAQVAPRELARSVAYLPQVPSFEPGDRVIDVLRLGRSPHQSLLGLETEHDERVVQSVAADLGLADLLSRPLDTLSGGQRQRVFLGRALTQEPHCLMLDEPATYLDLRHQVELYRLLVRLKRERNLAIVIAAHDLNLVALHCDRALVLRAGQVLATGPIDSSMTESTLSDAFGVTMKRIVSGGNPHFVPVGE